MVGGLLLRDRDFRLLWTGETVSLVGSAVSTVALPLVAVEYLSAGPFEVGLLTAAVWTPWLLIGLFVGVWIDRVPRRPAMLAANAISLLALGSVPFAAWWGWLTVTQLVVVGLVGGAARVVFETAFPAYLPSLLAPKELPEGNAALQVSTASSLVAGPSLTGLLAASVGAMAGVVLDAASFLVSALCLGLIGHREPATARSSDDTDARGVLADVRVGLRFVFGDPYLRTLTLFGAASNTTFIFFEALQVVFLLSEVGVGPGAVGLLVAVTGVGGVLGALLAAPVTHRWGSARGLLLIEVGGAAAGLLVPWTQRGPLLSLFVVGTFGAGLAVGASNVIKAAWRQSYCPSALLGRVTAATQLLNYGLIPLGALLGGVLGAALGTRAAVWIAVLGVVASLGLLLASPIRRDRDLPAASTLP